jgi:hypothetical protein
VLADHLVQTTDPVSILHIPIIERRVVKIM